METLPPQGTQAPCRLSSLSLFILAAASLGRDLEPHLRSRKPRLREAHSTCPRPHLAKWRRMGSATPRRFSLHSLVTVRVKTLLTGQAGAMSFAKGSLEKERRLWNR